MMKAKRRNRWLLSGAGIIAAAAMTNTAHAQSNSSNDALLNTLIKKGILSSDEAQQIKSEQATNDVAAAEAASKWKINKAIKSVELFGDLRLRYEYRSAEAPNDETLTRERFRYAVRLGLRGEALDNFYYGLRLETSTSNPRSSWVTFGDSTGGVPNQGPFSKNSAAIAVGQVYVGWHPEKWLDLTVGKMPNMLYSTPMVWDPDLNPEGAMEKLSYSAGNWDFVSRTGQFLYQDADPDHPAPGIFGTGGNQHDTFMLAWQLESDYHFCTNTWFRGAGTVYNYTSHGQTVALKPGVGSVPFTGFAGNFVGQGTAGGNNFSSPTSSTLAFNQTGINDLLVLDFPAEFNFPIGSFTGKVFGDFAFNTQGNSRAFAAATAGKFTPQTAQNKAYQIGFALGHNPVTPPSSTLVRKGSWEVRAYWQHTEQYAVDVNLIDSDYFEGRANLEGFYSAFTYNITDNVIGALRYGRANRIDENLGTGGVNADLPWINPINHYQIFQADLTYKF